VEGGACACEETPKPTKPRKRASKKKVWASKEGML
jgi:hypothetical protein